MIIKEGLKPISDSKELTEKELLLSNMNNLIINRIEKRDLSEMITYLNHLLTKIDTTKININIIKEIIQYKINNMEINKNISRFGIITYSINVNFIIPKCLFDIKVFNNIEQLHLLSYIKNFISNLLSEDLRVSNKRPIYEEYDLISEPIRIEIDKDIEIIIPFKFKQISEFYDLISKYDSSINDIIINKVKKETDENVKN